MSTAWSGSRAQSTHEGAGLAGSSWMSFTAMLMFAGNTATKSAIIPNAASLRVGPQASRMPSPTSAAPLR